MSKSHVRYLLGIILTLSFGYSCAQENASNPLAAVSSTDLRAQFLDLDGSYLNDYFVDGAYMLTPKLKLKYELHYWNGDVAGPTQSGFQSVHIKPVYFPLQGQWGAWKYKLAVGLEWVLEFNAPLTGQGCPENTIYCTPPGTGSDQLGPFVGLSLVAPKGTVLIPLLQQYVSYNGPKVNLTAARLIAIQSLPKNFWGKLDLVIPYDWENEVTPATTEIQLGKMFKPSFGTYLDLMAGIGKDKPYDLGFGLGVRFNY